ncbi:MAG: SDR family oxidoreductase, partial [Gammaproteobacteria bacterium]
MSHILVTGASGGIGTAICKALAVRGVTVVLHYQSDRAAAEATRQAMEGGGHTIIQGDLGNPTSIQRLWQEAAALQRIDAVVNNAGIFPDHPPLTTDYADWTVAWQRTLAI